MSPDRQYSFDFILIDDFSMMSVVTAVEPLRVANRILGTDRYVWHIRQEEGATPLASNALTLPAKPITEALPDYTFVCAGMHTTLRDPPRLFALLNRRYAAGGVVGAVSLATDILARAGLLRGRRCVIHWEGLAAFRNAHPDVTTTEGLFEIDGRIMTSCGGLATLDLFLEILKRDQESWLVQAVSNQLQIGPARAAQDKQTGGTYRLPVTAPQFMHKAIALIDQTLDAPLKPEALGKKAGASRRTLDRQFIEFTGQSVAEFYLTRRLEHACGLLRYSNMPILEIALSAGFSSGSNFSARFRQSFGETPRKYRASAR